MLGPPHGIDHVPNGDFMEAILRSSFDWNGIREAYLVATENDSLNRVAMMLSHLLTGEGADYRACAAHGPLYGTYEPMKTP